MADRRPPPEVRLVAPGPIETLTGGYLYDRRILAELASLGWRTHLVPLDPSFPMPTAAALDAAGSTFEAIPSGELVVIDGLALTGLLPLLPSIAARLRPVALIHHPLADETGIDSKLAVELAAAERAALALVPGVIVTSPWTRRRLADYGVPPERITAVLPGVDRAPDLPQPPNSGTVRLLTVATITPRKGHLLLIEALSRLKELNWSLRLAGGTEHDPQHAEAVRAAIARESLQDRVVWLGELSPDQVAAEYASCSLFVLPSYLEGYGMALAEAIAHGLPVVSTTAGAIPDTVPAAAGRLVPPGDVDALTKALERLIGDDSSRYELARGARDSADTIPTWAESAATFADALLGSGGR
jgi:glycosyltransferase involved in cell wall biosynthesis